MDTVTVFDLHYILIGSTADVDVSIIGVAGDNAHPQLV